MGAEFGHDDSIEARQQEILLEAQLRYGEDACFVYPRPADKQLITMTLAQAMAICGKHMAGEDDRVLWATLDKWYEAAQRLKDGYPLRFEASLALGRQALEQRGLGSQ